ncbi:protein lifeguard 1-like isoform X1 [Macrosteles quadrilineatus]|uniref:protein lifeguard 1-like isoform X2 n=1 Tax=Macrosteles quadrilineatus TaxID=74068 RepID=UPI0023E32718|nr:protein lifeguard 1-like isoform X2 [Macrosteles quadrilineatus]XP_054280316.1 protein lifeguard 1-like isoform X1 [Macrosteles quadrilineatus]
MSDYGYGGGGYGGPPGYPGGPPPPPGSWTPPNRGYGPDRGYYGGPPGPPQYGYECPTGPYPQPPGYSGGCPPPPPGPWIPPNRGYDWYQWERPSHCRGEFHWIHCEPGQIPYHAVHAGRDKDGGPLYAGRAYYEGDLLPAKIAPSHHKAYVPWGGKEHVVHQFEVLISHHAAWEEDRDGRVPPAAMVIGQTVDGENLYMGRTMHDGTLTPGKIQPSHRCLYIPYGGHEIKYHAYEVLILN